MKERNRIKQRSTLHDVRARREVTRDYSSSLHGALTIFQARAFVVPGGRGYRNLGYFARCVAHESDF